MLDYRRVWLLSFSGVDGAGKSTQIENLEARLLQAGIRTQVVTFWDSVAVLARLREFSSHAVFEGDKGVGSPDHPVNRRDKNVTSRSLVLVRFLLYLLDAVHLRWVIHKARAADVDVIIFDRYLYDELANLPLANRAAMVYVRWLLKRIPKPDIAYFLDVDPEQARQRKPEYPIEFVRTNRNAYLALSKLIGGVRLIPPLPLFEAEQSVTRKALQRLCGDEDRFAGLQRASAANLQPTPH